MLGRGRGGYVCRRMENGVRGRGEGAAGAG